MGSDSLDHTGLPLRGLCGDFTAFGDNKSSYKGGDAGRGVVLGGQVPTPPECAARCALLNVGRE